MKNLLIKTEFSNLLPTLLYGLYMPMFFILCKKEKDTSTLRCPFFTKVISLNNGISWRIYKPLWYHHVRSKQFYAPNWFALTIYLPAHIWGVRACRCLCRDVLLYLPIKFWFCSESLYFRFVRNIGILSVPVPTMLFCTCHPF